jgi:2-polyprenyl-3-methyl-5-hydroxy-6-metoxy-1,4-benzoquinol methylase/Zn ribbon nucleic-acid-binding protein
MGTNRKDWETRWHAALREQHRAMFDPETHAIRREYAAYISCPVCGADDSGSLFEKDWFQYVKCQVCSMVYMNPRLNQAASYAFYNSDVNAIYNERKFDQVSVKPTLDDQINFANLNLIDRYRGRPGGTLLEIGSAKGYFLSKAKERGYDVYGIELNKRNVEASRRLVGDRVYGVDVHDAHFESGLFDVIYMRDVIEHIPNPRPFFRELNRIAKPGALMFIETHNIDGLIHQIVREKHTVIFGFEHANHWSPKTIEALLELTGFEVYDVKYVSLDFTVRDIIGYFIDSTFTSVFRKETRGGQRMFLRMILGLLTLWPLRYVDERVTPGIANLLGRGSVMKVLAKKKAHA